MKTELKKFSFHGAGLIKALCQFLKIGDNCPSLGLIRELINSKTVRNRYEKKQNFVGCLCIRSYSYKL